MAAALVLAVVPTFALASSSGASPNAGVARTSRNARVVGVFAMVARVTTAVGVRGEHSGQTLQRIWVTQSGKCSGSICQRLTLYRQRSAHIVERVELQRTGPGRYAGTGRFYVALSCLGRVYRLGSRVPFRITLSVTAAVRVQSVRFARKIKATYVNPARSDSTPCPLGASHDAARYTGRLASGVPSPPTASFGSEADASNETVTFTDTSRRSPDGAAIRSHTWQFGDPGSGTFNTSTRADPVHRFSAAGVYTVSLTVSDANGLTSTSTQTVDVGPQFSPSVALRGPA